MDGVLSCSNPAIYAQQALNTDAEREACDILLRAERKAGQLLKATAKSKGQLLDGKDSSGKYRWSPEGTTEKPKTWQIWESP